MGIQKSVCSMTGHFSNPFGDKKQYTTFASNGCQYFVFLEPNQQIKVDLEVRAVFEMEHESIVQNVKGEPKPVGMTKPGRFIRLEGEKLEDKK